MRDVSRAARSRVTLAALLVLAGCGGDVVTPSSRPAPSGGAPASSGPPAAAAEPVRGVTAAGCAQPAGGRSTPGNGCIYLGVLGGLTLGTAGEFAPLAQLAVVDFWAAVNAAGGIGGHDIDVETFARDTAGDPGLHLERYREIAADVLLVAHSWGTETTVALLDPLASDRMLVAPVSDWSGFHFLEVSSQLIATSAHSACLAPMLGLDWFSEQVRPVEGLFVVAEEGLAGADAIEGAGVWAQTNGVPLLGSVVHPRSSVDNAWFETAVAEVLSSEADVVVVAADPAVTAQLVLGVATVAPLGSVLFVGVGRSWSLTALQTPAAAALIGFYTHVAPWEDFLGEAPGHHDMRAAFGTSMPLNSGYAAGWIGQYPVRALIEEAAEAGDLSPASLALIAAGLEVSYAGILPAARGGLDRALTVDRSAVIGQVNPMSENGLDTLVDGYRGATAESFEYVAPCAPLAP